MIPYRFEELEVAEYFDSDDELSVEIERYSGTTLVYLPRSEVRRLREHLTKVLEDSNGKA